MAARDSTPTGAFERDLRTVRHTMEFGILQARSKKQQRHWATWELFCSTINIDPHLQFDRDPIPFLQVFALRVRSGKLALGGAPISSRATEEYLRSVGQTLALLGYRDPTKDRDGNRDIRLQRLLSCWKKEDGPPSRAAPIPVAVLRTASDHARHQGTRKGRAIADLIWIAFFFCMRPGEYAKTQDGHPFTVRDTAFLVNGRWVNGTKVDTTDAFHARSVSLTFTEQKNGVKGERISLGRSGDSNACPVRCLARRIRHLRRNNAVGDCPIHSVFSTTSPTPVRSTDITDTIRLAAHAHFLPATNISARSLRASGATALLQAGTDVSRIKLLGRWKSDEVFRYLHTTSHHLMDSFAQSMLSHG